MPVLVPIPPDAYDLRAPGQADRIQNARVSKGLNNKNFKFYFAPRHLRQGRSQPFSNRGRVAKPLC